MTRTDLLTKLASVKGSVSMLNGIATLEDGSLLDVAKFSSPLFDTLTDCPFQLHFAGVPMDTSLDSESRYGAYRTLQDALVIFRYMNRRETRMELFYIAQTPVRLDTLTDFMTI